MQRILIVDDSAALRGQLKAALGRDETNELIEAGDGLTALKMMAEHHPHLVVCDVHMPGIDGLKLLSMRRARPELSQIPFLMLTADSDADRKIEAFKRGASDYVSKPFHSDQLLARVRIHLRTKLVQDRLREAKAPLEALATTDALTGLHNRRHFERVLASEIARADRCDTPLSLIVVDIDHLKSVNDKYGHAMGDEVIRNLGALLAKTVRTTDVAARYDGVAIAVIFPDTFLDGASLLAQRLLGKFAATKHSVNGEILRKTASVGVVQHARGSTPGELLRRVEVVLGEAKRAGRNRVVSWEPQPPDATRRVHFGQMA